MLDPTEEQRGPLYRIGMIDVFACILTSGLWIVWILCMNRASPPELDNPPPPR